MVDSCVTTWLWFSVSAVVFCRWDCYDDPVLYVVSWWVFAINFFSLAICCVPMVGVCCLAGGVLASW